MRHVTVELDMHVPEEVLCPLEPRQHLLQEGDEALDVAL